MEFAEKSTKGLGMVDNRKKGFSYFKWFIRNETKEEVILITSI